MRVTIIGAGYVGLVSGACLADFGHNITCVDQDEAKIKLLNEGVMPIFEPGLKDLVRSNLEAGRLTFSTNLRLAAQTAEVIFVAVGTPSRRGDGFADLSHVYSAAREIAPIIDDKCVVVIKSTVPLGTSDEVELILRLERPGTDIEVVSNPEFLREGAAISDFKHPDRIVIGTINPRARDMMSAIYRPLYINQAPLLFTTRRASELIKYAANAFLAMKITYINEIADLCEKAGADIQEVATGIGLDNRIGSKFLHAGPGYGGSCFPKDTQALVKIAHDFGSSVRLVETTISINDQRKRAMARKVIGALGGSVRDKTLAILGLTFKPNTDDMREAPSLNIIQALQDAGALIRAYDPKGMESADKLLQDVSYEKSPYEAAKGSDAIVIVTEWEEFRALDLEMLGNLVKSRVMVDLRNIYSADEVSRAGFKYTSIGR